MRKITKLLNKYNISWGFCIGVFIWCLALSGVWLVLAWKKNHTVIKSISYKDELKYWLNIIDQHPLFRDAYLEVAYLMFLNGELSKANEFFQIAKELDPNSDKVKLYESVLGITDF